MTSIWALWAQGFKKEKVIIAIREYNYGNGYPTKQYMLSGGTRSRQTILETLTILPEKSATPDHRTVVSFHNGFHLHARQCGTAAGSHPLS